MRSKTAEERLFLARLAHQADVPLRQVSQAAMQKPRRAAAGSGGEIGLLDESDSQSAHGGVARYTGADDTAANDENIQAGSPAPPQGLLPGCRDFRQ